MCLKCLLSAALHSPLHGLLESLDPSAICHRAGSPLAGCSLVVGSTSAHADITLPANTELGAASRLRTMGEVPAVFRM